MRSRAADFAVAWQLGFHVDRAARALMRDRVEVQDEIDIPATVDATARAGGGLTLVREVRAVRPRFAALVETTSRHDHQAALAEAILERLQNQGVAIDPFAFRPDSELLVPADGGRAVWLHDVIDRQRYRSIWVFGDGAWLLSQGRSLLELARHREVVLYTSLSKDDWSERERSLARVGVVVTPAAEAWLREGAGQERPPIRRTDLPVRAPLPRAILQEAWTSSSPALPQRSEVDSVLIGLRAWLDDSGYQWLCSLAPLPVLRWRLTLWIGSMLRDDEGRRILNGERLTALARLPWFRSGSMPDWLRERLLRDLSVANAEIVHGTWIAWSGAASPAGSWDELELVEPVQDQILLTFLRNPTKHGIFRRIATWLQKLRPTPRTAS